jgi:mono/diheme cytochrome c family protein
MKIFARALFTTVVVATTSGASAGENVAFLFRLHCSGCHGANGEGSKQGRIPAFPGLVGHFAASSEGRLYLVHVPGMANAALPDAETADLLNYVLHKWVGREEPADAKDFTSDEVRSLREVHVDDVAALRQKLGAALAKRGITSDY